MQSRSNPFSVGWFSAIFASVICFLIVLAVDQASAGNRRRHLGHLLAHQSVTSVLVAGGFGTENQFGQRTVTNTAEVYDSSLATFSITGDMSFLRVSFTARRCCRVDSYSWRAESTIASSDWPAPNYTTRRWVPSARAEI